MEKIIKDEQIENIFAPLVDWFVEEKLKSDRAMGRIQLFPIEQQRIHNHQVIEGILDEYVLSKVRGVQEGLELVLNALQEGELEKIREECEGAIFAILFYFQELNENKEAQLPQNLGFSDETARLFYRKGYELFQQGRWEEALKVFCWMTFLNPLISEYWIAQGMAEQRCRQYDLALNSYFIAKNLNSEDPLPRYYAIYIHLERGDKAQAEHAFDEFVEFVNERKLVSWSKRFLEVKQQIEVIK